MRDTSQTLLNLLCFSPSTSSSLRGHTFLLLWMGLDACMNHRAGVAQLPPQLMPFVSQHSGTSCFLRCLKGLGAWLRSSMLCSMQSKSMESTILSNTGHFPPEWNNSSFISVVCVLAWKHWQWVYRDGGQEMDTKPANSSRAKESTIQRWTWDQTSYREKY